MKPLPSSYLRFLLFGNADQSSLLPQGSLRKEFPVNIGGSDVCFFCRKRVYVMERLSAEGKFFHRSCFKCDYCNTTLRLSSYAFDVEDGETLDIQTLDIRGGTLRSFPLTSHLS